MADGFNYSIIQKGPVAVVTLQGRLSKDSVAVLDKCQQELVGINSKNVILIFKDVDEVDHVAFRDLTLLQTNVRKNGKALFLAGLTPYLKKYLGDKGIIRDGECKGSLAEALKATGIQVA
ncbi:MAG: hypothetical protein ACLGG7_07685 [Bacteriovoracia bacterium]